jgi:hypothetical protein
LSGNLEKPSMGPNGGSVAVDFDRRSQRGSLPPPLPHLLKEAEHQTKAMVILSKCSRDGNRRRHFDNSRQLQQRVQEHQRCQQNLGSKQQLGPPAATETPAPKKTSQGRLHAENLTNNSLTGKICETDEIHWTDWRIFFT